MTVGELQSRMTSGEFTEWVALMILENDEEKAREMNRRVQQGLQQQRAKPARRV